MTFLRHKMNFLHILSLETSQLIYFDVQISPNPMYKIVSHTYFSMVSGLNPFGFEAITKTWDARYIMRFDTMANFITSRPKIIKYTYMFPYNLI
jgi:hypothetical protein